MDGSLILSYGADVLAWLTAGTAVGHALRQHFGRPQTLEISRTFFSGPVHGQKKI